MRGSSKNGRMYNYQILLACCVTNCVSRLEFQTKNCRPLALTWTKLILYPPSLPYFLDNARKCFSFLTSVIYKINMDCYSFSFQLFPVFSPYRSYGKSGNSGENLDCKTVVFSLVPDLLFDCSRVIEYAKIWTVLQSRENLNPTVHSGGMFSLNR